jgi:hypothetical protein
VKSSWAHERGSPQAARDGAVLVPNPPAPKKKANPAGKPLCEVVGSREGIAPSSARRRGACTEPPRLQRKRPTSRVGLFCGAEGDRTPDLCIANAALSQLSYGPGITEVRI